MKTLFLASALVVSLSLASFSQDLPWPPNMPVPGDCTQGYEDGADRVAAYEACKVSGGDRCAKDNCCAHIDRSDTFEGKLQCIPYQPPTDEPFRWVAHLYEGGVAHGRKIEGVEVNVVGNRGDLIDIRTRGKLVWREYLREDTDRIGSKDVVGNQYWVAVRYGHQRDLLAFFGFVWENGIPETNLEGVDVFLYHKRAGANHTVTWHREQPTDGLIRRWGGSRIENWWNRFCYRQGEGWLRSPGYKRSEYTVPPCSEPVASTRRPY